MACICIRVSFVRKDAGSLRRHRHARMPPPQDSRCVSISGLSLSLWICSNATAATDARCIATIFACRYGQLVDAHASVYSRAANYWRRQAVEMQQEQAREVIANQWMTVQFQSAAIELEKSLAERHALREAGDNTYRQHGHIGKIF